MNKREVGNLKEDAVCKVLEKHGYKVLERNYRVRQGEIDIVAKEDEYLVFVEVKYRKSLNAGDGFAAVDIRKQRQISKVALFYLYSHKIADDQAIRFDVASVSDDKVKIIKNAFDYIAN
ncbi:MAG: YraN family protein [Lachnospiraceae bacterium]|nr:YraN family protein [Lachnospiraceae bacterium]